jgi:MFS family permease
MSIDHGEIAEQKTTSLTLQQRGAVAEDQSDYTVFSKGQAARVIVLVATAGFFSPFTAFIYFPALQSISRDFAVSAELMNLTVTAYLLVQGIAPSILGDLSEGIGRRPVYLLCFSVYCAASLGLVFQRSYAALLILRMLQSAGSSGTIALGYGVIGDIAAPHKRGVYVGLAHIGFNSAPGLGPVIGGVLADRVGWPWIFVFLTAFSGMVLALLALFLFETARNVVGNGSIRPTGINKAMIVAHQYKSMEKAENKPKLRVPNIIPCFEIIFHKHTFPVLMANATFYMMYSILQATLAPLLQRYYGLSPLQAGLCYLSFGCASPIASVSLPHI